MGAERQLTRRALDGVGAVPVSIDDEGDEAPADAWLLPDDLEPVDTPGTWATLLPSLDPTVIAHRPDGTVAVQYLKPTSPTHRSLVDESIDRYLVGVGDTVVRPRYPAPLHSELISRVSGDSPA